VNRSCIDAAPPALTNHMRMRGVGRVDHWAAAIATL
jgi:hypothetical protein